MDLSKSYDFFSPDKDRTTIHIVGCGSVGSTIAENLVRCGITNICLYDFDKVEEHNIVNQMFKSEDVGSLKVDAVKRLLFDINPETSSTVKVFPKGWTGQMMSGYIFLCVDNIELRKQIVQQHFQSPFVKAVFDVRTGLTNAQHYAADWKDQQMKENLLATMEFTHEEAATETAVSACGVTLGVVTTVRLICAYAVNNYINFIKNGTLWKFLQMDGFAGCIDVF